MSALKSSYKILLDYNLVIEYHYGTLETSSYVNFKEKLINDPLFRPNLNHFIHFKNVEFATSPTEVNDFVTFMKYNISAIGFRKIALITNTPNQVVSTTIYKMLLKNLNQSVEIFSTHENALRWLKIPSTTIDKLTKVILKLTNTVIS